MMTKTPTFVHTLSGIPLPKYEHGDLVWYERDFGTTSVKYFGRVEARILNNDAPGAYCWEYYIEVKTRILDSKQIDFCDEDLAPETKLHCWQP